MSEERADSGSFERATVSMSTVLKWLGGIVGVTVLLAWGFILFRLDALADSQKDHEARIDNIERNVIWRHQ